MTPRTGIVLRWLATPFLSLPQRRRLAEQSPKLKPDPAMAPRFFRGAARRSARGEPSLLDELLQGSRYLTCNSKGCRGTVLLDGIGRMPGSAPG